MTVLCWLSPRLYSISPIGLFLVKVTLLYLRAVRTSFTSLPFQIFLAIFENVFFLMNFKMCHVGNLYRSKLESLKKTDGFSSKTWMTKIVLRRDGKPD